MKLRGAVVRAALLLGVTMASPAQEKSEDRLTMNDLPAAVKKTVLEVSRGLKLRGLTREAKKGQTFYEVGLEVNGRTRDVIIDSTGAVVLVEEEVTWESVPAAVRAAIEKGAAGGKIRLVETLTRNNQIEAYEAHVRKDGKEFEIKVDPSGKPIVEK